VAAGLLGATLINQINNLLKDKLLFLDCQIGSVLEGVVASVFLSML
jgi:hypothetical protein